MHDEVIDELWRAKDAIAKEFNYDVVALARELMRRQRTAGRRVVNLSGDGAQRVAEADALPSSR